MSKIIFFLKTNFNLHVLLIALIVLALTAYKLDTIPQGFQWDEAAYGYNAYSLLKTGKDEWGKRYPIFIKSFGEYKPGFLSYAIIPFFLAGGINQTMARLPVAISAAVGVIGLIKFLEPKSKTLAIITGLVLITNPWFLHYARIAFEPMPSLGFMLLGLWLWSKRKTKIKIFGALSLLMSMYIYNSARLFVPMMTALHLLIFHPKKRLAYLKNQAAPWILLIAGSFLILYSTLFSIAGTRAKDVFFWDSAEFTSAVEEGIYRNRVLAYPFVRIFNNKGWYVLHKLGKKYIAHFSPEYLLPNNNQTPAFSFIRHGNFLLTLAPFLVIGLISAKKRNKTYWFFFFWLLTSPIPSTLTTGHTNPNRSLIILPALVYFAARGIITSVDWGQKTFKFKPIAQVFKLGLVTMLLLNFGLYLHDWLIYFPELSEPYWHGFYKQASREVWQNRDQYNKVYFTNTDTQPYIFFAWYNLIEPKLVQTQTYNRDKELREGIRRLDNVYFWDVKLHTAPCYLLEDNVLVIASENDPKVLPFKKPPDITYTHTDRFHPEETALRGWKSHKMTQKQKMRLEKSCDDK